MHLRALLGEAYQCDEKRDRPWREFLAEKSTNKEALTDRHARVESWVALHEPRVPEPTGCPIRTRDDTRRVYDALKYATSLGEMVLRGETSRH